MVSRMVSGNIGNTVLLVLLKHTISQLYKTDLQPVGWPHNSKSVWTLRGRKIKRKMLIISILRLHAERGIQKQSDTSRNLLIISGVLRSEMDIFMLFRPKIVRGRCH